MAEETLEDAPNTVPEEVAAVATEAQHIEPSIPPVEPEPAAPVQQQHPEPNEQPEIRPETQSEVQPEQPIPQADTLMTEAAVRQVSVSPCCKYHRLILLPTAITYSTTTETTCRNASRLDSKPESQWYC